MPGWKYRRIATPQQVFEIASEALLPLLQQGALGPEFEFSPVGDSHWFGPADALHSLTVSAARAAPQSPADDVITGRPARAPTPVAPRPAGPATPPVAVPRERWKTSEQPPAAPPAPAPVARPAAPMATVLSPAPPAAAPMAPYRPAPPVAAVPAPVAPAPAPRPAATPIVVPRPATTPAPAAAVPASPSSGGDETSRPRLRAWGSDEEEELDLTPMIDVTFLLLIFFMVASTVTQFANLQLPRSVSGDTEDPRDRVVLLLDFPMPLADSALESFSGGQPLLIGEAKLRLAGSAEDIPPEELADRLRAEFQEQSRTQLILQAHRKIPASLVRKVLSMAREAGARQTLVAVSVER